MTPVLEVRGLTYRLPDPGGRELISDVSFSVSAGETLVLLGRSGSGKTTTLKLVNRLLEPTRGEVFVAGQPAAEVEPTRLRRRIGYVIQEIGLFPHVTVAQNVGLVPRLERWPAALVARRVQEMLALVGLDPSEFAGRYPHELSGGQRQRVGVARALAADPPLLLMDEPFGALDPVTRAEVRREFRALADRLGKAVVFVTHDVREGALLGHRIGLLVQGRLVFLGTADEFQRSAHPEARAFWSAAHLGEPPSTGPGSVPRG
ncbi:MAG TPA: ATP-binding cassette domain-containing protein [Gemmatimonadales bacterium]|nr:ATP-binding cassette domain-containing protein [Gemmatimonadales bacterium]